ncbi:hypothetical protein [Leucobacter luti]|uniref:hypothetical protein n=1 Tax=Leucobacter luti TaxID=340320 RepID=UPI00102B4284|nr:hypothetical protein [Leucobacter luti]MBL3700209.1 hypothetical protein [Leucobacter luti]
MTGRAWLVSRVAAVALGLALVGAWPAAPAAAIPAASLPAVAAPGGPARAAELIDVAPEVVTVEVPGPGKSQSWSMSVTNRTAETLPLGLEVLGDPAAALFTGPHPLTVDLSSESGALLASIPAGELIGRTSPLPPLAAGASTTIFGTVTLPREADNRYAEQGGELVFRYTAIADDPGGTPPPWLTQTGAGQGPLALTALALAALGVLTLAARSLAHRRKARQA